ncbi:MAG: hypothetical protein OHK93_008573 [Ramalina farinacea]|uniref:Uncharacterized protein n=1 Tax=Ramalina farinacea TaxID=258253 RepID=A0AA43QMP6_9LECA|nr:hypothetical protein [Ramalina farinacea]
MAALAYDFWSIKVTGKCAMMIDMSTRYDGYPDEDSDFSKMRDSMFILCIMNQCVCLDIAPGSSLKLWFEGQEAKCCSPSLPHVESECLLRLALFSNLLQLKDSDDARDSIVTRRTELARNLREGRKKGGIPIFLSFLWFVFALALTIELAFDDIGGNETAHNLALGLMVCWLPVLIVATAVDCNSVSADSIQQRFNELLEDVRHTLIDPTTLRKYKQTTNTRDDAFKWTAALHDNNTYDGEFFVSFGGQGREHFHYGVAHPILSAIETTFMAEYGRDWLRHGFATRVAMVGDPAHQTCECMSSNWANGEGGFIDFQTANFHAANNIHIYWSAGTSLSCINMAAGLLHIVTEYCSPPNTTGARCKA